MTTSHTGSPRIAVIGAGLAGLTCATALKGFAEVQLFEKSVFAGGRVSRHPFGEYRDFQGGQYITVSNPLFLKIVDSWLEAGILRPWEGWIVELNQGQVINLDDQAQRYTGYPNMQAVADQLANGCQVRYSSPVAELERDESGQWRLFDDRGAYLGLFDIVITATEANAVAKLAAASPRIVAAAENIDMTVCWSAVFAFEKPLKLPFDAAFVLESALSWVSRITPPEGSNDNECWVVHASPEWSAQYAASFRGRVMHALLDAFFEACDAPRQTPASCQVHCWRHAMPINTLGEDCLYDEVSALGACGDWCTAPRIEGAVLSGFSMADRVMKQIRKLTDEQASG